MEHGGVVTIVYHWHHKNTNEFKKILTEQLGNTFKISSSDANSALVVSGKDYQSDYGKGVYS